MVAVKMKRGVRYALLGAGFVSMHAMTYALTSNTDIVEACVITREVSLTPALREQIANCLGWQEQPYGLCRGYYHQPEFSPLTEDEVNIQADQASLYPEGVSQLQGNVEIRQTQRIINAQTAYIYRDATTKEVNKIELLGQVQYQEPDRYMIASKASINPQDKSGWVKDVLYRFSSPRSKSLLPAWGQAGFVQRFPNQDYRLEKATYSTCAPKNNAWKIEAQEITLEQAKEKGVAKNAVLKVHDWPLLYTPYLSFPTTSARKSGFLMPLYGYSNVGGFDLGLPYYWNIAPNYDATLSIFPSRINARGRFSFPDVQLLGSC